VRPVVITYTVAISACSNDKQWQQAHGLLALQTADLPGVITYTAAISACAKDVQGQQALGPADDADSRFDASGHHLHSHHQ
jgi:hypothetical protein